MSHRPTNATEIANTGHTSSRPDGSIVNQDGYSSGVKKAVMPVSATAQS